MGQVTTETKQTFISAAQLYIPGIPNAWHLYTTPEPRDPLTLSSAEHNKLHTLRKVPNFTKLPIQGSTNIPA